MENLHLPDASQTLLIAKVCLQITILKMVDGKLHFRQILIYEFRKEQSGGNATKIFRKFYLKRFLALEPLKSGLANFVTEIVT